MRGRSIGLAPLIIVILGVWLNMVGCLASDLELVITVEPHNYGTVVPERFLGMSFEPTIVINDPDPMRNKPEVFEVGTCMYNFMNLLQPGHIRIGGLLGESSRNRSATDPTHIAPLLEFARDIGWIIDWTLNFSPYNPEGAIPTIAYILEHGGDLLRFVGIGTEPENFVARLNRPEGWGMAEHREEFRAYVEILRKTFPDLSIYGPNISGDLENMRLDEGWTRAFTSSLAQELNALAVHYYPPVAPPGDLKSGLRTLLSAETRADTLRIITDAVSLAEEHGLDLLISETNTPCVQKATPSWGYFNEVGSALNVLDSLLLMAEFGIQGAAIHSAAWWYLSPIQMGDWGKGMYPCEIRPLAYAMLLFSESDPKQFVSCSTDRDDANVYAYAFTNGDGLLSVVMINKDVDQGFNVTLDPGTPFSSASTIALEGLWWGEKATLGGAKIKPSGEWTPTWTYLEPSAGRLSLTLNAATAILIVFD